MEISSFESAASGHPANSIARSLYVNATLALSSGDAATTLGKNSFFMINPLRLHVRQGINSQQFPQKRRQMRVQKRNPFLCF